MKKISLLITLCIFCVSLFAQNLWNDENSWSGGIPSANNNVTLDDGIYEVPEGYLAECKDLKLRGSGLFEDDTEIIVNGELIVHDDLEMDSDILLGLFLKPVKITIGANGKLVVKDKLKIEGNASEIGDKQIVVNGVFEVHKELKLENDDDDDDTGLELIVADGGAISLLENNDDDDELIDTEGGLLTFASTARINFAATSGKQYISDWLVFPTIAITGGATLVLEDDLDKNDITGDIIIENGTFDLKDEELSGNGTNQIIIQENGTLIIGGDHSFPDFGGGSNEFIAPDLQKGSTVAYDGDDDQLISGLTYWNLQVLEDDDRYLADKVSVRGILTVDDDAVLHVDNHSLTLISTGDGDDETGMIGPVDGDIVGDSIIVQRYLDLTQEPNNRFGWNDWCSPIVENTIKSWADCCVRTTGFPGSISPGSPFNSVLFYDATTITNNKNEGFVGATDINQEIGLGTGVRLYDGNFLAVLSDTGSVHVGNFTVNLKYKDIGNTDEEGWNLIGNPYACAIDWEEIFSNGVTGDVQNAFWLYSNATGYYTYNGVTGVGTGLFNVQDEVLTNGLIPSHKAFWVKANESGTKIKFKESYKNTGGATFLKSGNEQPELIRMQIESDINGYKNAAALVLDDRADDNFDPLDAEYFQHPLRDAPGIALVAKSGENLSINAIPRTPGFQEISLFTKVGKNGTYRLRFYDFDQLDPQRCLSLLDRETNQVYNIRETPVVSVNLTTVTNPNRFALIFGSPLQAEKLQDVSCFGEADGQVLINWFAEDNSYYNVFQDGALLYENLEQSLFIKDISGGVFTVVPVDLNGYCQGARFETVVIEPKEVIAQVFAPEQVALNDAEGTLVTFYNLSSGASDFLWSFDDGTVSTEAVPQHRFIQTGTYQIRLIANNQNRACADTTFHNLIVEEGETVGIEEVVASEGTMNQIYKITPVQNGFNLELLSQVNESMLLNLYALNGQILDTKQIVGNKGETTFVSTQQLSTGIYVLEIRGSTFVYSEKLWK